MYLFNSTAYTLDPRFRLIRVKEHAFIKKNLWFGDIFLMTDTYLSKRRDTKTYNHSIKHLFD